MWYLNGIIQLMCTDTAISHSNHWSGCTTVSYVLHQLFFKILLPDSRRNGNNEYSSDNGDRPLQQKIKFGISAETAAPCTDKVDLTCGYQQEWAIQIRDTHYIPWVKHVL